ncbi:MAG TPA: undecaprenyldiphospho-muramoylpentapeptide beta-N-acetylglucosaminyltransferase [Actinomycetota bacterium]
MSASLVIAAGGTGGHLIPAFAVAAAFERRLPDATVAFVGTARGMESRLVPEAGYPLHLTSMRPFTRSAAGVLSAASVLPATVQARRILRRLAADVVLGMGGYPSIPVVLAARTLRLPILLHEQNAVPGLANEVGARVTRHVAVSFPQTVGMLRHATLVGLPVREELRGEQLAGQRDEALAAFELAGDRRTVLIFGGSLGATRLNAAAIALAERWRDRDDVQVLIGTGRAHGDEVAGSVPEGKLLVRVLPYLERMDLAYAAADVVVGRAGASTVHELAVCGLPSILIPFPHARRREQDANARLLVDAGAAEVIADDALDGERLGALLEEILSDDERRARMAESASSVARPRAAQEMAEWLASLLDVRRG